MKKELVFAALLFTTLPSVWAQKKRVAVMDFDYGTVKSGAAAIFGGNVDVGKGISDRLVERLVREGTYSVIERKSLDKVVAEQNLSNSDRADPNTAAKIGRLLGVDAIIIGSITQFGRDDRNVGGNVLGGLGSKYGLGNVNLKNAKAVVGISARAVSIDTGEILVVASGKGESKRSGTSLFGGGGAGDGGGLGGMDMSSTNFANTIIGEATVAAVDNLRGELIAGAPRLPVRANTIDGLVADANGNTLVLNVGTRAGLRVGQNLQVLQNGREIRDPLSGKVIRRMTSLIGQVVITEADEQSSVGTFSASGTMKPKVGDVVKSQPKP